MINLRVLPIWKMREEDFEDALVISVVSPGVEHPKIKGSNVRKFQFHDVREDLLVESNGFHGIMSCMTKEIAESIVEVAISNVRCDRWVIHCEAGVSRSPGVAIGLASFIKTNPNEEELRKLFPCFNGHVADLVREALSKKYI